MRFHDRADAGRRLAKACGAYRDAGVLVLALPRGGVPVAWEVARALDAELDLLMVRKIGAPGHPEFGIGAVVDGHEHQIVLNDEVVPGLNVSQDHIEKVVRSELAEIERRRAKYCAGRPPVGLRGRTVIIVDDGIATGGTLRAAIMGAERAGAVRVVVAVPVAPADAPATIAPLVDDLIVLSTPADFVSVGNHYVDFRQVEDGEVVAIMREAAGRSRI